MKTATKVIIGLSTLGMIPLLWWVLKAEAAPPEEGETKCIGYDLHVYESGEWTLLEENSLQCGWTPPPVKATLGVDTTPVKGKVYIDGVLAGTAPISVMLDPADYVISFGAIAGYITPADISITLAEAQIEERTVVYEEEITPPVCQEGETKCIGYDFYICQAGQWQLSKANAPECGYTPPPECPEGQTKCVGYDRYTCTGGKWIMTEKNSLECGYTPPPGKATLKVYTIPTGGMVYLNGVYQSNAPWTKKLAPGTYTVSFGSRMGYTTPADIVVALAEGEVKEITGEYGYFPGELGSLRGKIYDAETGKLIKQTHPYVRDGVTITFDSWKGTFGTGEYKISAIVSGPYTLRASRETIIPGQPIYADGEWAVTIVPGDNIFDIYLTPIGTL